MKKNSISLTFRQLIRDRSGNFAMMTGLLAPVLIGAAGFAVDLSSIAAAKRQIQETTDFAAISTTNSLTTVLVKATASVPDKYVLENNKTKAELFAKDVVVGQMSQYLNLVKIFDPNDASKVINAADLAAKRKAIRDATTVTFQDLSTTTVTDGVTTTIPKYRVKVSYNFDVPVTFMSIFNNEKTGKLSSVNRINSTSTAETGPAAGKAFSLFFITDVSQSMGDEPKFRLNPPDESCKPNPCTSAMESARQAFIEYLNTIENSDDGKQFIRVGGIGFNRYPQAPSGNTPDTSMSWSKNILREKIKTYEVVTTTQAGVQTNFPHALGNIWPSDTTGSSTYSAFTAKSILLAKNSDGKYIEDVAHGEKSPPNLNPRKAVVILSDGASMDGGGKFWANVGCSELKQAGVEVFTLQWFTPDQVTFDSNGNILRESDGLTPKFKGSGKDDYELMRAMCATQDGQHYFEVQSKEKLLSVLTTGLSSTRFTRPAVLVSNNAGNLN